VTTIILLAGLARNPFPRDGLATGWGEEPAMPNKPKSERIDNRPTEDEIAEAALGGPRGSAELEPAKPERKTKLPLERDDDPGHTA
jgi:hypothetical protein